METGFFDTNPDEARLNNALDLLLDCLLQPARAGEHQTQEKAQSVPDKSESRGASMKTNVQSKASDYEAEALHRVVLDQPNTLTPRDTQHARSLRLLWRIYALAFAAAERQELAHQNEPQDGSCPQ